MKNTKERIRNLQDTVRKFTEIAKEEEIENRMETILENSTEFLETDD